MRTVLYISFLFLFVSVNLQGQSDKLAPLRTNKRIETIERVISNYYTIQVLALKEVATNPGFFNKLEDVKEFVCTDNFVRYTVGEFPSFSAAQSMLTQLKSQGFTESFITNTKNLKFNQSSNTSFNKNGRFTIQLSAFRFPVYLSYFKNLDNVKEYYLKDKIYRYCVGDFSWSDGVSELNKIKSNGYKDAHIVSLDKYRPFEIE